jgi:hypothetical protein
MLLALQAAATIAAAQPQISLSETSQLRKRLRKYCRHGLMASLRLSDSDRVMVRKALQDRVTTATS